MKKQVLVKSAKEQFDADVKNATYIGEVAGIHYWYDEDGETAQLHVEDPTNKDYWFIDFPLFEDVMSDYKGLIAAYMKENGFFTRHNFAKFVDEGFDGDNTRNKELYCDFLFTQWSSHGIEQKRYEDKYEEQESDTHVLMIDASNTDDKFLSEEWTSAPYKVGEVTTFDDGVDWKVKTIYALPDGTQLVVVNKLEKGKINKTDNTHLNNVISADHTDINAFSSMFTFLKKELITKIETMFINSGLDKFEINPVYDNNEYFDEIVISCDHEFHLVNDNGEVKLSFEDEDCGSDPLSILKIEELLCIYSQLHN